VGNILQNVHFDGREEDGRLPFKFISGKWVVIMEDGWSWLRIVSTGQL
jgi:hypothetical protein